MEVTAFHFYKRCLFLLPQQPRVFYRWVVSSTRHWVSPRCFSLMFFTRSMEPDDFFWSLLQVVAQQTRLDYLLVSQPQGSQLPLRCPEVVWHLRHGAAMQQSKDSVALKVVRWAERSICIRAASGWVASKFEHYQWIAKVASRQLCLSESRKRNPS